jgi:hypothetical protein
LGVNPRKPINSENCRDSGVERSDEEAMEMRRAVRDSNRKVYKPLDKSSRGQLAIEKMKLFRIR